MKKLLSFWKRGVLLGITVLLLNLGLTGQSSCLQCSLGVCEGSSLSDYVTIEDGNLLDITGDVDQNGTDSDLASYTFSDNSNGEIILDFVQNELDTIISVEFIDPEFIIVNDCNILAPAINNVPAAANFSWNIYHEINGAATPINHNPTNVDDEISLPLPLEGTYSISLELTSGSESCVFSDEIALDELGFIEPGLEFEINGATTDTVNGGYIIPYCGSSGEIISVNATATTSSTTTEVIKNETELIDGPNYEILTDFIIPEASSGWTGENIQVCIIQTQGGCELQKCYYVQIVSSWNNNAFNADHTEITGCAPSSLLVNLNPAQNNAPGTEYNVQIICNDVVLYSNFWNAGTTLPEEITFSAPFSSCECESEIPQKDAHYIIVAESFHPCIPNTYTDDFLIRVGLNPSGGITVPEDTLCSNSEDQNLCYENFDDIQSEQSHCNATFTWTVTCPDGINCSPENNSDPCLQYQFDNPGIYLVELEVDPDLCPGSTSTTEICVNPEITDLEVEVIADDSICTPNNYPVSIEFEDSLLYCDPLTIEWNLEFDGLSILDGSVDVTQSPHNLDFIGLQPGEYDLFIDYSIDDCDDDQDIIELLVQGGPRIDSNIVDIPCVGQQDVVFDNWFCVEDSLSDISDLNLQFFESANCDVLGLSPILSWEGDPLDYDPCASDFGDDFVWGEAEAGDFVLLITAENGCDIDSLCIQFEIEEPEPLTFENIELDYCIGETVNLSIFAGTNPPSGVNAGVFEFICPVPVDCPSSFTYGESNSWYTAGYPPGQYTIEFSMACYESVDTIITLHENPIIDLGPSPVLICDEDTVLSPVVVNSLTLDPNYCNWTYPGGPSNDCDLNLMAPITPGTYIFSGETVFECPGSATLEIDIETFQVDGSNLAISCNQAGLDLNQLIYTLPVSPGDIMWQICDATGNNCNTEIPDGAGIIDLSAYTAGSYQLLWNYTSLIDCDYSGSLDFEIGDLETPNFSTEFEELCLGETITINELGNLNGSWNIVECPGGFPCSETFSSDNTQFTWNTDNGNGEPGPYLIEYSGVCIDPDTVTIIINDIPSFNVIGAPLVCQDSLVELTTDYIGSGTFVWTSNTGEVILGDDTSTATVDGQQSQSTIYTLEIEEGFCAGSVSFTVNHELQPWTDLNESFSFCDDSVTCLNLDSILISNGWSNPAGQWIVQPTGATIGSSNLNCANFQLLDPNTYDLVFEYTSSLNCPYNDTISLDITDLQSIQFNTTAGPDSICAGLTYSPDLNLDPLLPEVAATLIDCPPAVSNCNVEVDLTTYVFDEPGTYSILLEGTCYADTIIDLVVNPIPEFGVSTANSLEICPGSSITLEIDYDEPDFECEWTNLNNDLPVSPDTDFSITVSPSETTVYQAVVDDLGCTDTTTVEVIVLEDTLSLDCIAWNDTICANDTICLNIQELLVEDASDPNFTWFLNDEVLDGTSFCVDTLDVGVYYIKYEYIFSNNLNTCTFTDSCEFEIIELAPTELQYNNQQLADTIEICLGDGISIESGTIDTLGTWSIIDYPPDCYPNNADTLDPYVFNWSPNSADNCSGIYTIMYTAVCKDTAFATIEVFPNPDVNIQIDPGELICEDNSVTITVDYIGENTVINVWLDPDTTIAGDEISPVFLSETQFEWNINSGAIPDSYTLYLEDGAPCPFEEEIQIDIQQVDFGLTLCNTMQDFCANTDTLINLPDIITGTVPNGQFTWYIILPTIPADTLEIGPIFNPSSYPAGDYTIYYDFQHGESPNCIFSDTCSFTIEGLNPVTTTFEIGYCLNDTNLVTASYPDQYSGSWQIVEGDETCLTIINEDPNSLQFVGTCPDAFTLEFAGECLETEIITFEILSIPTIGWTPSTLTPCANEDFYFASDLALNFTDTLWTFGGQVGEESPLEFTDGSPQELCFEAVLVHEDYDISCAVDSCHILDPIESPGNVNLDQIPGPLCAGLNINIGNLVNLDLYESCNFNLPPFPQVPCNEPLQVDQNGPYGLFDYELTLSYEDGCQDEHIGSVFIPEPPSADISMVYDSCDANVIMDLPGLQGDDLSFNWTVEADTSNFTDTTFVPIDILDDNTNTFPDPNPIPLGDAGFFQDTPFIVGVTISNPSCDFFPWYTINLADTGLYVSPPVLDIDVFNGTGEPICTPAELIFQANIANTNILDSLAWYITYVDELIYEETVTNETLTPEFFFENTNVAGINTISVTATAWNRCGSMTTTEEFYVLPDSIYFEIPPSLPGTCSGETLTFTADPLIGEESIDQIILDSDVVIPGLSWSSPDSVTFNVFIPETTPPGEYELKLTMIGCGEETDYIDIEIFPDPDIGFDVENEGCSGVSVFFENQTEGATEFLWDFGDGTSPDYNDLPNPEHIYTSPGTYYPSLTATSDHGCTVQLIDSISIYGPDASFELDEFIICSGEQIHYNFNEQDNVISVEWEFILPGVDTMISVADTNTFITMINETDEVEFWTLALTLQDIFGCTSQEDSELIVFPQPTAFFTHSTLEDCIQGDEIEFNNQSSNWASSFWDFGDPESGLLNQTNTINPSHVFSGAGQYTVTLTVTNSHACSDEYKRLLRCNNLSVYVPNAFTPDENGVNDIFKPVIYGIEDIQFEESNYYTFEIFNRWGERVFATHDPQKGWNGKSPDGEYYSQSEVYNWRVNIIFPDGAEDWVGHVTLVR